MKLQYMSFTYLSPTVGLLSISFPQFPDFTDICDKEFTYFSATEKFIKRFKSRCSLLLRPL